MIPLILSFFANVGGYSGSVARNPLEILKKSPFISDKVRSTQSPAIAFFTFSPPFSISLTFP